MKNKRIAIIGYGVVGKGFERFFAGHYEVFVYDIVPRQPEFGIFTHDKTLINECDMAVVCVPTNSKPDGSADMSAIEEVFSWLATPLIIIKSAVPPGTTDRLNRAKPEQLICVSPEYMGEGKYFVPFWKYAHPTEAKYHDFMVIGGHEPHASKIVDIFSKVTGPACRIYKMAPIEAEIVKYMENSWGATKVTFANEYYEICKAFGADWQKVREGFLADGRVERMHTMVREEARGFGGKCFPKDIQAIVQASERAGYSADLLKEVIKSNARFSSR